MFKKISSLTILGLIFLLISSLSSTALAAKDKIAVLVDATRYTQVSQKFDRYITEVEQNFPVSLIICKIQNLESQSPAEIRNFLKTTYQTQNIKGAVLTGLIPFALWKQGAGGNSGISSIYYEDLDGSFEDRDNDGYLDYHIYGVNEGPEIWIAWMRPPKVDPAFYLNRLFDKAHDYYTGVTSIQQKSLIACMSDYDNNFTGALATYPSLTALYGASNVLKDGESTDLTYSSDILGILNNQPIELLDTWQHANESGGAWDIGYCSSTEIGSIPSGKGPLIAMVYGCHSADFFLADGANESNINYCTSFPFGTSIAQVATGTSWSYGTSHKFIVTDALSQADDYFGAAWMKEQAFVETKTFAQNSYSDRDPAMESAGDNLIGNPFVIVKFNGNRDSDNDGMSDRFEFRHSKPTVGNGAGLNRFVNDANIDSDNDGYTNIQEFTANTDPTDPSSKPNSGTAIDLGVEHFVTNVTINGTVHLRILPRSPSWNQYYTPRSIMAGISAQDGRTLDGIIFTINNVATNYTSWYQAISTPFTQQPEIIIECGTSGTRNIQVTWWGE